MNRVLLLISATLLLILSIVFKDVYFSAYLDLVTIFLNYFLPALFPSIFLILIIYHNIGVDDLYQRFPRLARFIELFLASFGGTLISNEILNSMRFSSRLKKELGASVLIGSSFTFFFFIFTGKENGIVLAVIYLSIKMLLALSFLKYDHEKVTIEPLLTKAILKRSFSVFVNMALSMFLVTLIVPPLKSVFEPPISELFLGLIEFTRASKTLAGSEDTLMRSLAVFVLEFNGITSLVQVKNSHPEMRIFNLLLFKGLLAFIYAVIFWCLLSL